ncbi:DUF2231 domain-containing protein [Streptomyces sp. SCSIO 30461]|uniref:DUF2231 domain-containing protein n=1 Tax=Streptomyces sp. SCSIO 30461 TaxID=3118085 RepID=UPI0030D52DAB
MFPDVINGIPAHALYVHAVVVLLPLTAVLLVVSALWPTVMRRLGISLPVLALVSLALVPVTTSAGEWLEQRVQENALVERHAELGEQLLPWAAGLFVVTVAVWWVYRRAIGNGPTDLRVSWPPMGAVSVPLWIAAVVLALAVGAGTIVQVYRIGDSGAQAVWRNAHTSSAQRG